MAGQFQKQELQAAPQTAQNDLARAYLEPSLNAYRDFEAAFSGQKTFKLGANDAAVPVIKGAFASIGVSMDSSSNQLTAADIESIRSFQSAIGLKADGIVGRNTLNQLNRHLVDAEQKPLPGGFDPSRLDNDIATAQRALNTVYEENKSVAPLREDGEMGSKTIGRIRRYQKARGIEANGELTAETMESLRYDLGMPKAERSAPEAADRTDSSNILLAAYTPDVNAPRLSQLLSQGGTLTRNHADEVIQILSTTPDMPSLKDDFARSTGRSLVSALESSLRGYDREIALLTYGLKSGEISRPDLRTSAEQTIANLQYAKEETGF